MRSGVDSSPQLSGIDTADTDLESALAAAREGVEWGFVALYRDLQPRLLRYATALIGPDAEDVTAETWLQVARDLHRFDGDLDGFRGWASTICRHRAADAARVRARRPCVVGDMDTISEPTSLSDTADDALTGLSSREAIALIATLPQHEAEAVLLRTVVGLDTVATGTVLGKSAGAVRIAAHRGLKRLGRMLDEQAAREA
ncbi:MAG: polymerase sigma-70 factor, subfamily [Pseudonocardiales bacterium]|nr:polymerase sigma-70 factor, subfamily [Pseudonocardiales bacterium]